MSASIWSGSTALGNAVNADYSYKFQRFDSNTGGASAGQTVFNLTVFSYAPGTGSLDVAINGVQQAPGIDFTDTTTSSFTLTTGIEAGDIVDVRGLIGSTASQNAADSAAQSEVSALAAAAAYQNILGLTLPQLPLSAANGGTGRNDGLAAGLTATLPINKGGTNATTAAAAFLALAPAPVTDKVIGSDDGLTFRMLDRQGVKIANSAGGIIPNISAINVVAASANYTLPDITGAQAVTIMAPSNATAVPATITTSDGWVITTGFTIGTTSALVALSTATSHGWWGSNNMSPPKLNTNSLNTSGSVILQSSVALSAVCHIFHFVDVTFGYAILVAVDPTTGAVGSIISGSTISMIGGASGVSCVFATGPNSFALFYNTGTGAKIVGCTVAGTVITQGAATNLSASISDVPVQLGGPGTSTFFMALTSGANDLVAATVVGTVVTVGVAVASGAPPSQQTLIGGVSATTALVAFPNSAASACAHGFRVATIIGTTITLGVQANTNIGTNRAANLSPNNILMAYGGTTTVWAYAANDNTVSANTNWYTLSIAGTTVTVGAGVVQPQGLFSGSALRNIPYIYWARGCNLISQQSLVAPLDPSRILCCGTSGAFIVSCVGTVTTVSGNTGVSGNILLRDFLTGANIYATQVSSGTTYNKLSIAGTAITPGISISAWPNTVWSDALTDATVSYAGTLYKWIGVPVASIPLSANKYLNIVSTTLNVYGNFS